MKKNRITTTILLMIVATTLVMAADFNINAAGTKIFTVASNGTTSVGNLTVSDWITSTGNITVGAGSFFVGSGQFLTDISIAENSSKLDYHNITSIPTCATGTFLGFDGTDLACATVGGNSTVIDYHNITSIPTCGADTYLAFDGTDLACDAVVISHGAVTIDGANITSGTIAKAYLPDLANETLLTYRNITDIPSCSGTERLTFSGTELTCNATTSFVSTNIAHYNDTVTWAEDQIFSGSINVTKAMTLMSNDSVITRVGVLTNITIDSSGNVNINLG